MYQKILVALDETDSAARAAREAIALARGTGAELRFLHVGATSEGDNALSMAKAFAQGAGVSVTTARVAADGESIGDKVVHEAERWGADLIVAGRHNRGPVERLLLGSVSAAIVRASDLPVLLVRRVTPRR
jgi:nucleotide-binding universal stress UspA family protein